MHSETDAIPPTIVVADEPNDLAFREATLEGTVAGQVTALDATIEPFSGVTLADPNGDATYTLTITLAGTGGMLTGTGLSGATGGVFTLTAGMVAKVTKELRALVTKATAPGANLTTRFTLNDLSSAETSVVNKTTTVIDQGAPAPPSITGAQAGQTTSSEYPINPFTYVSITDPNTGASDALTIKLTGAGGTLSGSGLSGGTGGVYMIAADSPGNVQAELDQLTFTSEAGKANTSSTTRFTILDRSSAGSSATDHKTTVVDTDPPVAPTITGTKANQKTTSEASVKPFTSVTIADANHGASETVTISTGYSGGGYGTLTGAGLTSGANGFYSLSGTAAKVTRELDALIFTPDVGGPNTIQTVSFAISDQSSGWYTSVVDVTTTVLDTDPPVPPTITGTVGRQPTYADASIQPFADVTISDPNVMADNNIPLETLKITLSGGGGTLVGEGLTGSNGHYTLSGTVSLVSGELSHLYFTPNIGTPHSHSITTFGLSDTDNLGRSVIDKTTSVIDTDPGLATRSFPNPALQLVSANAAGQEGTGPIRNYDGTSGGSSDNASISGNGQFVVFDSIASNLVANETINDSLNGYAEIYVKNLKTGAVALVSQESDGTLASDAVDGSISENGHAVVFRAFDGSTEEIYEKNLVTGTLTIVSQSRTGSLADGSITDYASGSSDGSVVAFESNADDLIDGRHVSAYAAYAKNLQTGAISLVSETKGGTIANGYSNPLMVSGDGNIVLFQSSATNLIHGVSGQQIYAKNIVTGALTLVSSTSRGVALGGGESSAGMKVGAEDGSMSTDGKFVAFVDIDQTVTGDDFWHLFVKNTVTGALTVIATPGASSVEGQISPDGKYVIYDGNADGEQIHVVNIATGASVTVSQDGKSQLGNGASTLQSFGYALSAHGLESVFTTSATNLFSNDINGSPDIIAAKLTPSGLS